MAIKGYSAFPKALALLGNACLMFRCSFGFSVFLFGWIQWFPWCLSFLIWFSRGFLYIWDFCFEGLSWVSVSISFNQFSVSIKQHSPSMLGKFLLLQKSFLWSKWWAFIVIGFFFFAGKRGSDSMDVEVCCLSWVFVCYSYFGSSASLVWGCGFFFGLVFMAY